MTINRDAIVAVLLLVFCTVMFGATYDIEPLMIDPTVGPELWPRVVIGVLAALSLIYLGQSLRAATAARGQSEDGAVWRRFANPVICFVLFGLFAASLPVLGMLIGGTLFVFLALTLMGGHGLRALAVHAVIAVICIGGMWLVFTYALEVYLPQGRILRLA